MNLQQLVTTRLFMFCDMIWLRKDITSFALFAFAIKWYAMMTTAGRNVIVHNDLQWTQSLYAVEMAQIVRLRQKYTRMDDELKLLVQLQQVR